VCRPAGGRLGGRALSRSIALNAWATPCKKHGPASTLAAPAPRPPHPLSGASDAPMPPSAGALPFLAPESLAVTLAAPHAGPLRGLGVRRGVTLIVGGGFHGKSTLLDAIQVGCYDKVGRPGALQKRDSTVSRFLFDSKNVVSNLFNELLRLTPKPRPADV
jgi:hypothetical protein